MRRSLESLSRSRNMDMSKDPEGIANYADKSKTFEEHMRELKDLLSSLPNDENDTTVDNDEKHDQDGESGKRENKLNTIKDIKRFMGKDEQISVEELNKKIKDGISLADISATF